MGGCRRTSLNRKMAPARKSLVAGEEGRRTRLGGGYSKFLCLPQKANKEGMHLEKFPIQTLHRSGPDHQQRATRRVRGQ